MITSIADKALKQHGKLLGNHIFTIGVDSIDPTRPLSKETNKLDFNRAPKKYFSKSTHVTKVGLIDVNGEPMIQLNDTTDLVFPVQTRIEKPNLEKIAKSEINPLSVQDILGTPSKPQYYYGAKEVYDIVKLFNKIEYDRLNSIATDAAKYMSVLNDVNSAEEQIVAREETGDLV